MIGHNLERKLEAYLALRRAVGFEMRSEERLLRDFIKFIGKDLEKCSIRAQLAVDWACSSQCASAGQSRRLSVVRCFLSHLRASDPGVEVPAHGLLAKSIRPKPHIYSAREIESLFDAARNLGPEGSLRPNTYATLIGLALACGLRGSETARLQNGDVDLRATPACLTVIETKFRKSRLVPLHATTAQALREYVDLRDRRGYGGHCESFFVSERKKALSYNTVRDTFIKLARQVGIRAPNDGRGGSFHDLRHTFAVTRMIDWYRQGIDVSSRLPELSVYLGHARPEETYWYLTATPELLVEVGKRFEPPKLTEGDHE